MAGNLYWEFQRHLEPAGGEIETEGDFWAVGQRTDSIHRSVPFQKAYGAIQAPKPYPLKLASSFLPLQNHKVLEEPTSEMNLDTDSLTSALNGDAQLMLLMFCFVSSPPR